MNKHITSTSNPVYLVDGSRTPFLRAHGRPGPFTASDLALQAGRPLLLRQSFAPDDLDQVILGCVSSGPDEANIARVTALRLGCGERVPAWTVQRNCASGMQAVVSAAHDIAAGRADLVLAGGTEAMSHHPLLLSLGLVHWLASWNQAQGLGRRLRHLTQLKPAMLKPVVALLRGLTDPMVGLSMGQTAEQLAWRSDAYCAEHLGRGRGFDPIPRDRLNVDGGGISLGHPVGASGARIILHLLQVLHHNRAKRGIASLCVGGGQGGAVLVEAV